MVWGGGENLNKATLKGLIPFPETQAVDDQNLETLLPNPFSNSSGVACF